MGDYFKGLELFKKGRDFFNNNEYEKALPYLDDAISNGVIFSHAVRANCLKELEYYIDAIVAFNSALIYNTLDCHLYYCRGVCKHTIGDLAGALSDKILAIEFSKIKNAANEQLNEIAIARGSKSITQFYELYTGDWENDFQNDMKERAFINKLKETGVERNIELANARLMILERRYDNFKSKKL